MARNRYRFPDRKSAEDAYVDASQRAYTFGRAILALKSGESSTVRFTALSLDGETFRIDLIRFRNAAGRAEFVVVWNFGATGDSFGTVDELLPVLDEEVRDLGRDYFAFDQLAKKVRWGMDQYLANFEPVATG